MKQTLTTLLIIMFACIAKSQTVFDSFDNSVDSNYVVNTVGLSPNSRVYPFQEHEIVSEGQGALRLEYTVESIADWGGSSLTQLEHPDSNGVWDFSSYESLSIDFYNKVPASTPGRVQLHIHLYDVSDAADIANTDLRQTEWWYSFHYVLDRGEGWYTINLPLKDVGSIAADGEGSSGFWLTGWDGIQGNGQLDLDKIRGIGIEVFMNGPLDSTVVSGEFIFDNFVLNPIPTSVSASEQLPNDFALEQNYPNPFNPTTTIKFNLPEQSNVRIDVFNTLGQQVKSLVNGEVSAGEHSVKFDASALSSSVYLYRMQAGDFNEIKKMILTK